MTPNQIAKTSEHSQQAALFCYCACAMYHGFEEADKWNETGKPVQNSCWCMYEEMAIRELKWFHAIPNGGDRDQITAGKMKAEGVKSGVLDCFLPVARKGFHGLYIEMKKPGMQKAKNGGLSENQVEFGNFAVANGYKCVVCYTWIEAVNVLKEYLS